MRRIVANRQEESRAEKKSNAGIQEGKLKPKFVDRGASFPVGCQKPVRLNLHGG
jgi:hypothetical protein